VDFFFKLPKPSSRTMALRTTQSLAEMSKVEWSAPRLGRFVPRTYWIEGCVDSRGGMDVMEKNLLSLLETETQLLGQPVAKQTALAQLLSARKIWRSSYAWTRKSQMKVTFQEIKTILNNRNVSPNQF
jgi:hypothetical protein